MKGGIPRDFIDALLARVDIVDVIDGYVPLRKAGKDYKACCPFHEEKTPSFTVSQDKQFYHCFGCGASGNVISFLREHAGLEFVDAVEELAKRCGMEIPSGAGYQPTSNQHQQLYDILARATQFYRDQLGAQNKAAAEYLKQRGINDEIADDYELGYAPPGWQRLLNALGSSDAAKRNLAAAGLITAKEGDAHKSTRAYDRFRNRLMFPIRDTRGRVIAFGGRVLGDDSPKYLNSPETPVYHKGRELYGLYQARRKNKKPAQLYVVEGYMDVIALAQHGVADVVATLGTAATERQLEMLFRATDKVVFCFDGDAAGTKAAGRALALTLPLLRDKQQAFFKFMPQGSDPDDFIRAHGAAAFRADEDVTPLSDFLLQQAQSGLCIDQREGRAGFLDRLIPQLTTMPESSLRQLLLQEIADIAQLDVERVIQLMQNRTADKSERKRPGAVRFQSGRHTLMSNIVSYLLNKPDLAHHVEDTGWLAEGGLQGADFLAELIEVIHNNPEIRCAGLLERWRDTRYEQRLKTLATPPAPAEIETFDWETQFLDAMDRLRKLTEKKQRSALAEQPLSGMTEADKTRLRRRQSQA